MAAIYLTELDATELIDMPLAIEAVATAFGHLAAGEAEMCRASAPRPGHYLAQHDRRGGLPGLCGLEMPSTTRAAARFHVGLYEQATGNLVVAIEADQLGRLRTGALRPAWPCGYGARRCGELGLFGTGRGRTQLAAAAAVLPLAAHSSTAGMKSSGAAVSAAMQSRLSIEVVPVDRPQEAAEDLPIVITATGSATPVFDGGWLAESGCAGANGAHAPRASRN